MESYAVANGSGSVGKTVTVSTLATLLALGGVRTRVFGLDPQCNLEHMLGQENPDGPTIADVLRGKASLASAERPARYYLGDEEDGTPVFEPIENLTVVPAVRKALGEVEVELPGITGGVLRLKDAIDEAGDDDVVNIFDCAGGLDALVLTGLLATAACEDEGGTGGLISVTKAGVKENEGLSPLLDEVAALNKTYRTRITLLRVVPCDVPSQGTHYSEEMEDLRRALGDLVTPQVSRSVQVPRAYKDKCPIPLHGYASKSVRSDYEKVLDHMREPRTGLLPIVREGKTVLQPVEHPGLFRGLK